MKRISYFIAFLCSAVLSASSFAAEPLSLEDCLLLAKKNNLKLVQARVRKEQAEAGVMAAYSLHYPSVDLSSGYNRSGEGYSKDGSYSTGIGLRQTLFKGGYVRIGTRIARLREGIAEENCCLTESEVFLSVKEAFFEILQRQEQIVLVDNILKRRGEDLVLIRLKYDAGRESAPAVKETEANLLQAKYDRFKAKEDVRLAKASLNLLLGRDAKEAVSLDYQDEDVKVPDRDDLIKEAIAMRAEIRVETKNRQVQELQLSQAKRAYFPTISLSSSYDWQGAGFLEQESDWSVGANFALPLFTGFLNKANVREASLALVERDAKIQELEQSIEDEVEQAYSNWVLAKMNGKVSEKTLEAAREMYELTRLQYEMGRISYFFLQQKENSLTRAEYDHNNALMSLRTAYARLEKARGK
jgi:outer membrane protein